MDRGFDSELLRLLSRALADRAERLAYQGDVSDLGNEIGIAVGNLLPGMTEQEARDLTAGIRHGVSLTNGTH